MRNKNFFMLPNRIFSLGLKPKEFAVYCCFIGPYVCGLFMKKANKYGADMNVTINITFDAEAGKAGFLTVLYIIGVPIFGVFVGRKSTILLWIAVAFAVVGSYFLCNPDVDISKIFSSASSSAAVDSVEGTSGSKGWQFCDTLLILCAVAFTFHILVIDKCVQFVDAMRVATVQSLVAGVIALIVSIVLGESWSLEHVLGAAYSILYCAACSTGIGYSCQFLGQRSVHPVAASLIMSLESVFAAIGGYMLLGERMETMELWGCAIIFVAVILAQIPTKSKS